MRLYTFPKAEHICLRRDIEELFTNASRAMTVFPLRAVYRVMPQEEGKPRVSVLLSVAKRHLRKAVSRNMAKRQMREAYRKNKLLLTSKLPDGKAFHIAFIWLADTHMDSARVEKSIVKLLQNIAEKETEV